MKTLKKSLCFVLAVVMAVGTLVVSASAAFPDDDKIDGDYMDAAVLLKELAIIVGRDDGRFDPTSTLSRVEAAWFIARLHIGDASLANKLNTPVSSFSDCNGIDVNNNARGVIEYCKSKGIINGRTADTFDPNGRVNYAEFTKMALTALGYDSSLEGYTGANYAQPVLIDASRIGLIEDLDITDIFGQITRQEAAQIIYNALFCEKVSYSVSDNNQPKGDPLSKHEWFCFDHKVMATDSKGNPVSKYDYINGISGKLEPYMTITEDADGKPIRQFTKTDGKAFDTKLDNAQVIATFNGTFNETEAKKYKTKEGGATLNVATLGTKDKDGKISNGQVRMFYNGQEYCDSDVFEGSQSCAKLDCLYRSDNKAAKHGFNVTLYGEAADKVTHVVVSEYYFGEITGEPKDDKISIKVHDNALTLTITFSGKVDAEKDKYNQLCEMWTAGQKYLAVQINGAWNDGNGHGVAAGVHNIVAAQPVTGVIDKIDNQGSLNRSNIILSGQTIPMNNLLTYADHDNKSGATVDGLSAAFKADITGRKDVVVFVAPDGGAIYVMKKDVFDDVKPVETKATYAYVLEAQNASSDVFGSTPNAAQFVTQDGEVIKSNITVEKNVVPTSMKDHIVTYTENSDGTYTLKQVKNASSVVGQAETSKPVTSATGTTKLKVDNKDYVISNDTSIIVCSQVNGSNVYTAYKGYKQVPTLNPGSSNKVAKVAVYDSNSVATFVYIDITSGGQSIISSSTANDAIFLVVNSNKSTTADGTVYTFNAVVGGKTLTTVDVVEDSYDATNKKLTIGDASSQVAQVEDCFVITAVTKNEKGQIVKVTAPVSITAVGSISDGDEYATGTGINKIAGNGLITIDGTTLGIVDNCPIYKVENGTITAGYVVDKDDTTDKVVVSLDDNKNVTAVYVIVMP